MTGAETMIAKQMEVRSNIKKYFDLAYEGNTVIIPRKENKNVVIISEEEYSRLSEIARLSAYSEMINQKKMDSAKQESGQRMNVKSDNLKKLGVIAGLKDDWNGNGALSFSNSLINKVQMLLKELKIQPEVFPTALNTIQLEFDNSRRDHMEIEIGESESAEIFIVMYNGEEYFETIFVTPEEINKKVAEFMKDGFST
jgi:PHD/YefM family antitoxin component YafN of YafNO toxin-antitoxin module